MRTPPPSHASLHIPGRRVAAPSWVRPGTLADNCQFLAGKVQEVGLLFFETASSLSYTKDDLPAHLADLSLTYHVHLPLDLPEVNGAKAGQISVALMEKVINLGAKQAVLHPPTRGDAERFLRDFLAIWVDAGKEPSDLHVENIAGEDLICLEDIICSLGLQVCLDIGHLLAYKQDSLCSCESLLDRVGIIHLNAPGTGKNKARHAALTTLSREEQERMRMLCKRLPQHALVMLEMFSWDQICASLPLAGDWLALP